MTAPAGSFADSLCTAARPQLELQLAHPVVRGIGAGTLDERRFRHWLAQDYLFLLDYVRLFALAAAGPPAEPRYRQWVQTYADPAFAELAAWCAGLLDRVTAGLPPARLAACERAFRTSLAHELAFWDA